MQLLVRRIIDTPRFRQQSYRSILGIQRVSAKADTAIVEAAAKRANERSITSSRAFTQILEFLVGKHVAVSTDTDAVDLCQSHNNIRGGAYYH
jgi:hypothetical protein